MPRDTLCCISFLHFFVCQIPGISLCFLAHMCVYMHTSCSSAKRVDLQCRDVFRTRWTGIQEDSVSDKICRRVLILTAVCNAKVTRSYSAVEYDDLHLLDDCKWWQWFKAIVSQSFSTTVIFANMSDSDSWQYESCTSAKSAVSDLLQVRHRDHVRRTEQRLCNICNLLAVSVNAPWSVKRMHNWGSQWRQKRIHLFCLQKSIR